jgi:biotin-dependent carboxylase-like uncharacterized protein
VTAPAPGSGLEVLATGPLCTVQDEGRTGQGALGIGRSGACDRASAALANRLVGNPPGAALLEVTFGGLALRAEDDVLLATAGARCAGPFPHAAPTPLRRGRELRLGVPATGLRTYVAVRGGLAVPPVLGSRSTDVLAGLGPPIVAAGQELPVGEPTAPPPTVDLAPVADPPGDDVTVPVLPGPRADWFGEAGWAALAARPWTVTSESNRVGLRLDGGPLRRVREGELPSEGMVRGALQVPPSGLPVLFLADHPVTGGYPVIGYVVDADVDRCAQLRPGQALRFRASGTLDGGLPGR